jgi:putative transposase
VTYSSYEHTSTNRPLQEPPFPCRDHQPWVWLYYCFCLSYRDVEEMLFVRGVIVSYEAIRKWCRKFGQQYANQLRRRRPRPGDKWQLDAVFITINKQRHYLWRAVDQDGNVLDILVQSRRNKQAAKKLFRKLLKGCRYVPRVIITDKLKSYGAAKREMLPGIETPPAPVAQQSRGKLPPSDPPAGATDARGLSRLATPNGFSPRMGLLPNTSDHAGIAGPRLSTVKKCSKDARCGKRSRARR